ncbi:MAG: alanine racemase [Candidatus Accumulibacter sp.]|jgi:alanine racemase|nr:alanine racemase [Accumulibacter sp.]
MPRPIRARIDASALRHNFARVRQYAADPKTKTWAVVKADAYGHGLLRVAHALNGLADGFALLDIQEGIALREAGYGQPILLLEGFFEARDIPLCARYALTPAIHCIEQLEALEKARLASPLPVYLKLNTGMNRLGFTLEAIESMKARLFESRYLGALTLMTHFADADGARGIAWQMERFQKIRAIFPERLPVSMANSAAILRYPETVMGWIRPGIVLYGASPFEERSAADFGLKPVMTLTSRILEVQEIVPGERVGYGGLFTAQKPSRIGIVACGYADGYPRHAPGGTPILVAGRRTVTAGRVSMDMLTCDLTGISEAGMGSPVTLWGDGLAADEVAASSGTVAYELFCALARRVPVVES